MLPPDHYGCGCTRFTGTLAAVEEHERECAHWLHNLLPEGLQHDLFSGNENELALTLLDVVELLQCPLSVLQKARRHALASPPLVASEEMLPLESANQHPTPSQKLTTSKQPTSPAAPASAPPLSSALISPSSLSLNLLAGALKREEWSSRAAFHFAAVGAAVGVVPYLLALVLVGITLTILEIGFKQFFQK